MSVNIFGSSGGDRNVSSRVSKTYIDQKFITLSTNLNVKVNKSGDTMTGPLNMGDHKVVSNYTPLHDGDLINKRYGDLSYISQSYFENQYKIIFNNFDVVKRNLNLKADKTYVDLKCCIKNNVGYIPDLISNDRSKNGFKASASSSIESSPAYYAFNVFKTHWVGQVDPAENQWIKIQLPAEIRIYKFALRGSNSNSHKITQFTLSGSNDDVVWTSVYASTTVTLPIGRQIQFFNVGGCAPYSYYKLEIRQSENSTPTLSYFQIFSLDEIDVIL